MYCPGLVPKVSPSLCTTTAVYADYLTNAGVLLFLIILTILPKVAAPMHILTVCLTDVHSRNYGMILAWLVTWRWVLFIHHSYVHSLIMYCQSCSPSYSLRQTSTSCSHQTSSIKSSRARSKITLLTGLKTTVTQKTVSMFGHFDFQVKLWGK